MRDVSDAFAAAITADILYPIFFYEIEGSSSTLRVWTGIGDRIWNGQTWAGVGWVIGQSEVEEATETRATSLTLAAPVNTDLLSIVLLELKRNRAGNVWLGLLAPAIVVGEPDLDIALGDPASGVMLGAAQGALVDVQQIFSGLFDVAELDVDPGNPAIRLRYSSKIADLERARVRRQTHEDQQIDYPGDKFFQYVGPLSDAVLNWGGT